MARNQTQEADYFYFTDALALLRQMLISGGLANLIIDSSELLSTFYQIQSSNHKYLPMHETAYGLGEMVPLDWVGLLYAILAFCCLTTHPNSRTNTRIHELLKTSKQLLDTYTGQVSLEVATALFLLHLVVIAIGSTNHAKSLIGQTVQACHELKLNRLRKDKTTSRGTWLYLLVYMADTSVTNVTLTIIITNQHTL